MSTHRKCCCTGSRSLYRTPTASIVDPVRHTASRTCFPVGENARPQFLHLEKFGFHSGRADAIENGAPQQSGTTNSEIVAQGRLHLEHNFFLVGQKGSRSTQMRKRIGRCRSAGSSCASKGFVLRITYVAMYAKNVLNNCVSI